MFWIDSFNAVPHQWRCHNWSQGTQFAWGHGVSRSWWCENDSPLVDDMFHWCLWWFMANDTIINMIINQLFMMVYDGLCLMLDTTPEMADDQVNRSGSWNGWIHDMCHGQDLVELSWGTVINPLVGLVCLTIPWLLLMYTYANIYPLVNKHRPWKSPIFRGN